MFAAKIQTLAHFINDSGQFGRQTGFDQNRPRDKWLIYLERGHSGELVLGGSLPGEGRLS